MPKRPRVNRGQRKNSVEDQAVALVDRVSEFEKFEREVMPALRESVAKGEAPTSMRKKYLSHATARLITEALTNPDATKALAAIKEIFDREEGKAVEKKAVEHRLGKLPEKELDALLISTIDDLPSDGDGEPGE